MLISAIKCKMCTEHILVLNATKLVSGCLTGSGAEPQLLKNFYKYALIRTYLVKLSCIFMFYIVLKIVPHLFALGFGKHTQPISLDILKLLI